MSKGGGLGSPAGPASSTTGRDIEEVSFEVHPVGTCGNGISPFILHQFTSATLTRPVPLDAGSYMRYHMMSTYTGPFTYEPFMAEISYGALCKY